jgi:cob(I)alamin adenosyltransferase
MTSVGPQGDRGVAQVAQVTNRLAISLPAKLRLLQDGLFELGISDLAVRHRWRDTERAEESAYEENCWWLHRWSDLWESELANLRRSANARDHP